MIVVRDVFQAKYGKADDLVKLLLDAKAKFPKFVYQRILTDASGPFFTVVAEAEVEDFSAWEKGLSEIFADPEFPRWFSQMENLVDSGQRQFFRMEMPER
ncbi:MAG: hypothetical protein QME21_08700 [Anaerolineales bacterium]|nr:hypothetical protein [Anaerolineales bacterium]